jgi:signal transduction histidine kinase
VRIPAKLSLAMIVGGFVIFGAYGVYELHTARSNLYAVIEQGTRLLGRSLQKAMEDALRDRQLADIDEIVKRLEGIDPSVDVLVYEPGGRLLTPAQASQFADAVSESALQRAIGSREVVLLYDPADNPHRAVFVAPLINDNRVLLGGLVVIRPLLDLHSALQATQRGIIVSVLLFVVTTSVLGLVLGMILIGRPLGHMVAAMRAVRAGNLRSVLPIGRKDEMGAVAAEFNAMVTELRQARGQLEDEAESRRRLQRALQEADKLITIGQLAAGLAHEIGSPLQILNGRARALLTRAQDPTETRRNAEILVSETDRIARIVEQLLRFARRRPVTTAKTDLRTTVNNILDVLQYEARRRGVSLTFSGAHELPSMFVDADGMQQIVLNLVTNALIATQRGGSVSVSVETSPVTTNNGQGGLLALRLVVADTGCGMSAEVRGQLFEPFFTTRAAQGGTGLGLAVVKSIVTDHDGTISVASEPGAGTRFTVDLPVSGATATQETHL